MTDIIQELRSLIAKATPGPWEVVKYGDGDSLVIHDARGDWRVCFMATPGSNGDMSSIKANADFIAMSRTHIEALLDRLEAAERGVDYLDMRRPIKGIECRSNEEVFAIMADRIRLAEAGHYRLPAIREVKP
ncbi:hypothetical protein K3M67_04940 [Sphingobium sp. V4]|uniref:hypothetical protein n=1 Tax=Sphingobium sp. V4 TaxID=3038927 RepID=UPI002557D8B2|nr:hypothetical protein [Sphingobium sp. V4]WIW89324.1 hypothetical protein K3M67_04940 [Sphingobium sp. V4]